MSTRNSKKLVFFEAPDFGFGPASAAINVIGRVKEEFNCTFIGFGASLALARQALSSGVEFIEIDTFYSEKWGEVLDLVPSGSPVVSITNLQFAEWAIAQGYRVGIIDTLFWMWDSFPPLLREALFYAAQSCFFEMHNSARENEKNLHVTYTAPIIDQRKIETPRQIYPRTAVIGLGGMSLPLDPALPFEYARWMLNHLLPLLFESEQVDQVQVIGGSPELKLAIPECFRLDSRVKSTGFLAPEDYRSCLLSSELLFLTPGLATVYETAFLGVRPIFLPGFNMSMVLQGYYLSRCFSPERNAIVEWPWMAELCPRLSSLREDEGVGLTSQMVRNTMRDNNSSRELFCRIEQCLQDRLIIFAGENEVNLFAGAVGLPSAVDIVRSYLG